MFNSYLPIAADDEISVTTATTKTLRTRHLFILLLYLKKENKPK